MARRKPIPSPLETARDRGLAPRAVAPAVARARRATALPTAAALAIALAGFGCSAPMVDEAIGADPSAIKHPTPAVTSAAPSVTAPALNAIEPTPHAMPGEAPMVLPAPPVTTVKPIATVKPYVPSVAPSGKHKLAGKPAIVRPHGTIY